MRIIPYYFMASCERYGTLHFLCVRFDLTTFHLYKWSIKKLQILGDWASQPNGYPSTEQKNATIIYIRWEIPCDPNLIFELPSMNLNVRQDASKMMESRLQC